MSGARRLSRALEASAAAAGCAIRVQALGERPWSSPTFVGARHDMLIEGAPAGAMSRWLGDVGDSLEVPGHVVAEIAIGQGGRIAALLLDA